MDIYWLWLSQQKGVGPVTLRRLVEVCGSPQRVYEVSLSELPEIPGVRKAVIEGLGRNRSLDPVQRMAEAMRQKGIQLLTFMDPLYPKHLNEVPNVPVVLYYRGSLKSDRESVGIVGSRRCTAYGKQVAAEAAGYLAQAGVTVVSGMAKGIDSYAHTASLQNNGYTLAFLGNGVDICYPPEHASLLEAISEQGAVISAYPPGTRPRQEYFPLRNQLLAAWVDKLLVVEAGQRSGALITADYAMKQKKKVFAVPNSIYSSESVGSNRLLLEGAEVYLGSSQLINSRVTDTDSEPGVKSTSVVKGSDKLLSNAQKKEVQQSPEERVIIGRLEATGSCTLQELLEVFGGELNGLSLFLIQMELEGKIRVSGDKVTKIG